MIINCLKLRDEIAEEIKKDVAVLKSRGITPSFAIIQIGNYPPSDTYVHVKMRKAKELGIDVKIFKFEESVTNLQKNIEKLINQLNQDKSTRGIIIQRPLPPSMSETRLQSLINPNKDIDGLSLNSPFINPLVQAVVHVINYVFSVGIHHDKPLQLKLIVVGKGRTAGKPIFDYFQKNNVIHLRTTDGACPAEGGILRTDQIDSQTPNPDEILKKADIIISCVGKPNILRRDNIKKGVVLISVGQHQEKIPNDKLKWVGDYNEDEIANLASFYTPTPRGIGPLNVIFLLKNVVKTIKS